MDFTVKLTSNLEKQKAENSALQQRLNERQRILESLQHQVAALEQQAEQDRQTLQKAGIDLSQQQRVKPSTIIPSSSAVLSGSSISSTSLDGATSGSQVSGGIPIIQLLIVALIAFILGNMFRVGGGAR